MTEADRLPPHVDRATLCLEKWKGHICKLVRAEHARTPHLCLCNAEWVTGHPFERDALSSIGACWCGHPADEDIHGEVAA